MYPPSRVLLIIVGTNLGAGDELIRPHVRAGVARCRRWQILALGFCGIPFAPDTDPVDQMVGSALRLREQP